MIDCTLSPDGSHTCDLDSQNLDDDPTNNARHIVKRKGKMMVRRSPKHLYISSNRLINVDRVCCPLLYSGGSFDSGRPPAAPFTRYSVSFDWHASECMHSAQQSSRMFIVCALIVGGRAPLRTGRVRIWLSFVDIMVSLIVWMGCIDA